MPPLKKLEPSLHIFVLTALVGAHPLLELLARQPEFFVVHQWSLAATRLLALGLVFLLPLPVVALRAVAHAWRPPAARWVDTAFVSCVAWLFSLQLAHPALTDLLGDHPSMILAVVSAVLAGWVYSKLRTGRSFLTFLAPALLVVPLVFLLDPRIRRLGAPVDEVEPSGVRIPARFPIIFLLFDALSTTALVDQNLEINARRFPHLAALAADSTWFPNTSTVAWWTTEATPAMLTGRYPEAGRLPRYADHPRNLFTLLYDSYRIVFSDPLIPLCPPQINAYPQPVGSPTERLRIGMADLALVYLHRTFPPSYTSGLPPVDQGWGNFQHLDAGRGPIARFRTFLDTLEPDPGPTLFFHHTIFPHMPYQFLPSGKIFQQHPSRFLTIIDPQNRQKPSLEAEIYLYKRYLFQVGHVDQMVADLVARLEELGLYDQSMIIITSDHGGRTSPSQIKNDVFSTPLLIKRPWQEEPEVVRDAVSTLDLLPSLMDLLGMENPWTMDGRSFFSPDYQPPSKVFLNGQLRPADMDLFASRQALVNWKIEHFGLGDDPHQLYRAGAPHPGLLGKPLTEFHVVQDETLRVELDLGGPNIVYEPASGFVPLLLRGSLYGEAPPTGPFEVAVSINGTIEATATARLHKPPSWYRFRLTAPEAVFRDGGNEVRIWILDGNDPRRLIAPHQPG